MALPLWHGLEGRSGIRRQPVHQHEAYIVAGVLILAARIPEPHDQLKHTPSMAGTPPPVQPEQGELLYDYRVIIK